MINVNRIFNYENCIKKESYESLVYIATREISLYSHFSIMVSGKSFLIKRSLELLNSINIFNEKMDWNDRTSLTCINHRSNQNINRNIEKQIFINNFVFNDNDSFVHVMKTSNITIEQLEKLIAKIKEKKLEARITKEYDLDISDICGIKEMSNYYNLKKLEIIINKMFELYYFNNELLRSLETKKR